MFAEVLSVVSAQTEVEKERILSHERSTEVVDARYLLIYIMKTFGFYPLQIAEFLHQSPANIRKALAHIDDRISTNLIFSRHLDEIVDKISSEEQN